MKSIFTLFIAVVFCSVSLQTQDQVSIASAKITFNFQSKDVEGSLSGFESSSNINLDHITESKFNGAVNVETIKTGNFLRDWSLKGSKYFDADNHPKITFESTEVKETPDGFAVTGTLTLKGTSKTIHIDFKRKQFQLVGTTTLFSSDYGIEIKKDRADNKVEVTLVLDLDN